MSRQATVLGAGISGLTTALVAAESGWQVRVLAAKQLAGRLDRDYDPTFPSLHPAAFLKPLLCDFDPRWWAESWSRFQQLQSQEAGILPTTHWELYEDPACSDSLTTTPWTTPDGAPLYGRAEQGLLADLPHYLHWLMAQLQQHNVAIVESSVKSLKEALAPGDDLLFNCSGLAARHLASDPALHPVAGQLLRVKYDAVIPGSLILGHSYHCHPLGTNRTLYAYPRQERLILGGSQLQLPTEGDSPPACDALDSYEYLFAWNAHLLRQMFGVDLGAATYAYTVGLRPVREGGVRVELGKDQLRVPVVHNYGHGGGGVSLSWGCAGEAVRLATNALN